MTREKYFYRKLYQTKCRGDITKKNKKIGVPIGNAKITKKVLFHPEEPLIQYHQK